MCEVQFTQQPTGSEARSERVCLLCVCLCVTFSASRTAHRFGPLIRSTGLCWLCVLAVCVGGCRALGCYTAHSPLASALRSLCVQYRLASCPSPLRTPSSFHTQPTRPPPSFFVTSFYSSLLLLLPFSFYVILEACWRYNPASICSVTLIRKPWPSDSSFLSRLASLRLRLTLARVAKLHLWLSHRTAEHTTLPSASSARSRSDPLIPPDSQDNQ